MRLNKSPQGDRHNEGLVNNRGRAVRTARERLGLAAPGAVVRRAGRAKDERDVRPIQSDTLLGRHAIDRSMGSELRELGRCGRELVTEQGAATHERREHVLEIEECSGLDERALSEFCSMLTV